MGMVLRPRRGMVLSLMGMAGLRGRLGPRTILANSLFSIIERVTLRSSIASRTFIIKSSSLPMQNEGAALYWVGQHIVSAAHLLAAESHERGEWILMTDAHHSPIDPANEQQVSEMAQRIGLFHSLTLGYPFPTLHPYDAGHWGSQQAGLFERLERLNLIPKGDPDFQRALVRTFDTLMEMLEQLTPEHFAMVHGDLDVNNLVVTDMGTQALDWGLARVDVPMVDLAHLLASARLNRAAKERVATIYFDTLEGEWPFDRDTLRRLGSLLYHLYFVEWHSRAIVQGLVSETLFYQDIVTRLHSLAHAF
ncbi:MAG: phosphotransferase [Ardenticatenales bacterium]|nr:phosphotransferase [Ardenticatenales bacterium]